MNNRKTFNIMSTWPFLICLGTLIANDWWFKATYSSFITGKLSDFSGVAIVGLVLFSNTHIKTILVYLFICSAFFWWKSPFSDSFIHFVNDLNMVHIGRVIDYSDLLALVVLPICQSISANQSKYYISWPQFRKIITVPIAAATLLAVMGTSVIHTRQEYVVRPIQPSDTLQQEQVIEAIFDVAKKHGLFCEDCSRDSEQGTFIGKGIRMSYSFVGNKAVSFEIFAMPNGIFFGASGYEKADGLRTSLKSLFAQRFEGLEYVEQLIDPLKKYRP